MIPDGSLIEKRNQTNHFLAPAVNQSNTSDELPLQPRKSKGHQWPASSVFYMDGQFFLAGAWAAPYLA